MDFISEGLLSVACVLLVVVPYALFWGKILKTLNMKYNYEEQNKNHMQYYLFFCIVDAGAGEKSVSFVTEGFPNIQEIEIIAAKKLYGDLLATLVRLSIVSFIEIDENKFNQLNK